MYFFSIISIVRWILYWDFSTFDDSSGRLCLCLCQKPYWRYFLLTFLIRTRFKWEPICRSLIFLAVLFCFLWYCVGAINTFFTFKLQDSHGECASSASIAGSLVSAHAHTHSNAFTPLHRIVWINCGLHSEFFQLPATSSLWRLSCWFPVEQGCGVHTPTHQTQSPFFLQWTQRSTTA